LRSDAAGVSAIKRIGPADEQRAATFAGAHDAVHAVAFGKIADALGHVPNMLGGSGTDKEMGLGWL
jgi:hypothetical protein